jgi:hypothetical protein
MKSKIFGLRLHSRQFRLPRIVLLVEPRLNSEQRQQQRLDTNFCTMEETSPSNQRLAFLSPGENIKERCLEEFNEYSLKEYRLQEEPESLKAFVDLFFLENGEEEENGIIWLTAYFSLFV